MPDVIFRNRRYSLRADESVLEGLLRHGASIPAGCRSGVCQCCVMRAVDQPPPAAAQKGLAASLRGRNHFLACQCRPEVDMAVALPEEDDLPWVPMPVRAKELLSARVVKLTLRHPETFSFQAGQFVNLRRGEVVRSYSIANAPNAEGTLELHVYRIAGGRMSNWLHDELAPGAMLEVQGAFGDCVYNPAGRNQPMLLIGTGCGLAALRGVIHTALDRGHAAPIHLFHGSRAAAGVYLRDEMRALEGRAANFSYTPCVSGVEVPGGFAAGRAADLALARHPELKGWRVYLCGNTDMVKTAKRKAFLAGAALNHIHSDPFEFSHALSGAAAGSGTRAAD